MQGTRIVPSVIVCVMVRGICANHRECAECECT